MDDKPSLSRRHFLSKSPLALAALTTGNTDLNNDAIPAPDYSIPGSGFHGKTENKRDWSPRSFKVVFVAHCVLNRNSRIFGAVGSPAMFEPLVGYLGKTQVGIIQMACPELYCIVQ